MILLLLHAALAASPEVLPAPEDVSASATLAEGADLTALTTRMADLEQLQKAMPEDCVKKWVLGTPTAGLGAQARLSYYMGPMRRRLTATVSVVEDGRRVELDHEGRKGFVTRFAIAEPADSAPTLTMTTYISAPPKPFQKIWAEQVQPVWEACWQRTVDALVVQGG